MYFFSGQNLSLKISTIQELPGGWSPYQGFAMDPRPLAEIVWYLLHSRKYHQPKKNSETPGLHKRDKYKVLQTYLVLNCFQVPPPFLSGISG